MDLTSNGEWGNFREFGGLDDEIRVSDFEKGRIAMIEELNTWIPLEAPKTETEVAAIRYRLGDLVDKFHAMDSSTMSMFDIGRHVAVLKAYEAFTIHVLNEEY